ncbi:50S ribosomal protein L23 [endosymbiont GvMRE of Glomus versiforme]|uniref:50S ribosomal protein L23 n=1 Tax=endosymbiont GvMRE of Glomus versiforme TaxID=2039283 RepID=UPI000ED8D32A|nr:50S ribosomal protein L23 [endosymbiont GvMRE of Glomus versiforme]RHZ35448.1 50S ribosomal protein L23 [endosymbiont GvMRE of Glomus versiforme]
MIIQKPILSEKSKLIHQNNNNVYSFYVLPSANKYQIKDALQKMFQVKIKKIRTSRQKPVLQKTKYLQKLPGKIYTKPSKKAFIELSSGQKLPNIFQE